MEEVMNALRKIQSELDLQKRTILENGEKVTETVTQNINSILEDKFKIWDEKYENFKEKLENQENRIYSLEKQVRKNNIVFFGIEETETSYQILENIIINFVKKYFSLDLDHRDIKEVKRLGRKGEKSRPIIATFTTLGIKIKIFKQRREALRETTYYIAEDYPKHILEKRKELQVQAKLEREKGNIAKIKYDKLVIQVKSKTTGRNKRMLSSPLESPTDDETNIKASKKNKHRAQTERTSNLSEGFGKPSILNFLLPPPSITGNKQKITTKTKTHLPTRLVTVEDQDHNPSKNRSLENKKNIDVCTINVRSLSSAQKLIELKEALTYVKHDIIGLSEVRRLGEKIAEDEDYITYHLGETKGLHGVGFLVKKEYKESIQNFTGISERVCILEILLEKIPFAIIQAYAPTESSTQEEIDSFYGDLEKAHRLISTKNEISMGDFNAQIGTPKPYENKVAGKYGFGNRNKRGEKLIQYAQEHNLKILNTMYKAKHKNRWTWISPDKNTRIMI
ncbi:hypothetical protein MSG28_015348 [Choristoneura fumiferana]|uniref:Uncharacterized protein n=1 Tax=Choristoneura fumiferana TaxID=7141 RepID=A0ACC0KAR0_CHOFU|nr:hypothetical protein MSG28_015348 [Choristoneura fumiferana]